MVYAIKSHNHAITTAYPSCKFQQGTWWQVCLLAGARYLPSVFTAELEMFNITLSVIHVLRILEKIAGAKQ